MNDAVIFYLFQILGIWRLLDETFERTETALISNKIEIYNLLFVYSLSHAINNICRSSNMLDW